MKREVTVIGAGVIGLSTGIRLLERGYPVRLVARELPPETTSNRAAAIWYPYRAYPEERVLGWGRETFAELVRLMDDARKAASSKSSCWSSSTGRLRTPGGGRPPAIFAGRGRRSSRPATGTPTS